VPELPNIPSDHHLDFVAWQTADGIPSEIEWVWNNMSYEDCIKGTKFADYRAFIQQQITEHKIRNAKR